MFLETIANINNFCYKNIYLFKVLPGMGGGMVTTIIVKPVLKGHLWDKEKVVF
jgi:hypothetical protein